MDRGLGHFPDSGWKPFQPVPDHGPLPALPPFDAVRSAPLARAMQQLIDDPPEQIALLDSRGAILAVNRAWQEIVEQHGFTGALAGDDCRDVCARSAAEGYQPAVEALAALDEMSSGNRSFWQLNYHGGDRWSGHDFRILFRNIEADGQRLILATRFDLTEILELRRLKDEFNVSLVESQSVEGQRFGRELHDSTSQFLTAIGLTLARLKLESLGPQALVLIEELQDLLHEAQGEIRSISYLAHPPALEKLGLSAALQSLVEGYARRTGLQASFEIQGEMASIPAAVESAIYRLAQEAISNVHRHACATRVWFLVCVRRRTTHFVIADNGVGFAPEALAGAGHGVGLASMRARLSEIGGRLSIRQLTPGTAIIASVSGAEASSF